MDEKLTQALQDWLHAPADQRDHEKGSLLFLRLSGNKIIYRNLITPPITDKKKSLLESRLKKYLQYRLANLTHEQVEKMQEKVDEIVEKSVSLSVEAASENAFRGKRPDHDLLPQEIQKLWIDNLDLLHKKRDLHLKLRSLSLHNASCPDSERYPFLKEIIALDKKERANWKKYDAYPIQSANEKNNNT